MSDVNCPYCDEMQEINHDDGQGYEESKLHQQQCYDCEMIFTFETSICFYYDVSKTDCLNGGEHKWVPTITVPRNRTKMFCKDCHERRPCTEGEMGEVLKGIRE